MLGQGTAYVGTMVTETAVLVQVYAIARNSFYVGLAGLAGLWLAWALLALAGAADLVSVVYRQTILQTYAPDAMRGRLQGVFTVVVAGGPRLGDLRSGAMASATGLTTAWTGTALACIPVALLIGLAVRPFWRYRAGPADQEPGTAVDVNKDITIVDSDIEVT